MKAVGYIRVSTQEQAENGQSLEAQGEAIGAYCRFRGLELLGIVFDSGVSASVPLEERPGGKVLLGQVKRGMGVVAFKLDRLFRNAGDCLGTVEGWDKRGVALHLLDMGGQAVDTASAAGKFMVTILAGVAEMERNLIAERTRLVLARKSANGERVGRFARYGCRLTEDGKQEEDPGERQVIVRILELKGEGLSPGRIAERLNTYGVPARGERWHRTTVMRILEKEMV